MGKCFGGFPVRQRGKKQEARKRLPLVEKACAKADKVPHSAAIGVEKLLASYDNALVLIIFKQLEVFVLEGIFKLGADIFLYVYRVVPFLGKPVYAACFADLGFI